ncbi:hypothetical protein CJF42_23240 [Pseudoalteromonas sp. NBT06-2]|uniref:MAC/perforin domain-containing protein n=1 Tax=Pseudoalteromonas sp. NBT06-2 TaxID=2025950 RepID=UPI000BA689AC|nr:MAC/perforin domain-containing protein [Pseudoalteromonas sp. NBT06-2]PAJ72069.1 hypothetical protein CJF42_23240 [Pseudoalteromonas sp. NBT06-2]
MTTTHKITPTVYAATQLQSLRQTSSLNEGYLPGVEALGAGYDIFGDIASPKSIIVQLFNWQKDNSTPVLFNQDYVIPQQVDAHQQDGSLYSSVSGMTIHDYQKNLSVSIAAEGETGWFSGSINNDFNSESAVNAENQFSRIEQTITLWSLAVRPDYAKLRSLLYPGVLKDIDNITIHKKNHKKNVFEKIESKLSADDKTKLKKEKKEKKEREAAYDRLFNKYGSHFLSGIIMGGKTIFSSSTNKIAVKESSSNEMVAKAAYQSLTGQLSAEAQTKYKKSINSFKKNSSSKHSVYGGKGIEATKVFSSDLNDFYAWTETVRTSPDFIDFMQKNGLTGIWELCKHTKDRDAMHRYYTEVWLPAQTRKNQVLSNYIDDIIVIQGNSSKVDVPAGYSKINTDLNKGAGGDYVYLCYHTQAVNSEDLQGNPYCITGLTTIKGKEKAPKGFTKLSVNLNADAGGKHIYFCIKKEPYNDTLSIKDLRVIKGDNPNISAPYEFTKIKQNLIEDAGGDYIYACYSTTV